MAKTTIELSVNGDRYEVTTDPWRSLAEVLREDLRLIGTKVGCNQGDCGACTVHLEGRSICSCLTLAVEAHGRSITTIEGVARGPDELHPLQRAFVAKGAVQCGFCSAGMIMSAHELLRLEATPTDQQIKLRLAGNLCRCTGYYKIVDAVRCASEELTRPAQERGSNGAPSPSGAES